MNLTLDLQHSGKRLRIEGDSAGANNLELYTSPGNSGGTWPAGTYFEIFNALDNGDLVVQAQSGVTINDVHGSITITPGQFARVHLTDKPGSEWDMLLFSAPGGGGSVVEPQYQVVVGTGAGVESSADFGFNTDTGALSVNQDNGTYDSPGDVSIFAPWASGNAGLNGGNVYIEAGGPGGDGGQGGEVIIRSGGNNQQGAASRSELLLSTAPGDEQASDVYLKAGSAQGGNNGGNVTITTGTAVQGGNGGEVNISGGNSSGGTNVFAGGVFIAGGSISGAGVEGTGGDAFLAAGGVQANSSGAYQDGNGGNAVVQGGVINGAVNFTGTAKAGEVQLIAGYADNGDAALGGDIVFRMNNGATVHRIKPTGDLELDGSVGTAGQVLTSQGAGNPPTWETPSSGGGNLVAAVTATGNPIGWFVADDIEAFRTATQTVTPLWPNRSSSWWDMAPLFVAGGQEPTYQTNVVNGHDVVRFDGGGTGDLFNGNSTEALSTEMVKQATIFAVLSPDQANTKLGLFSKGQSFPEYDVFVPSTSNAYKLYTSAGAVVASVTYPSDPVGGQWYICTWQVSMGAFIRAWRNGGAKAESTSFTGSMTFSNDGIRLGRTTTGLSSQFFDGDIAEFLYYPRALTLDQINEILEYLSDKYNIAITPAT